MKFSYCFSLRITPIGWPEQIEQAVLHGPGVGCGVDVDPAGEVLAVEQVDELSGHLPDCANRRQSHDDRECSDGFHACPLLCATESTSPRSHEDHGSSTDYTDHTDGGPTGLDRPAAQRPTRVTRGAAEMNRE